jgi:hypothetical protein
MAFCGKIAGVAIGPRMSAWKSVVPLRKAALSAALFFAIAPAVDAGHEVPYYPSFYPQEIRIEPLDPEAAAREFVSKTDPLHAYLGAAPRFAGQTPDHLKSVQSLKSLITVTVNPRSQRMRNRDARCQAIGQAAASLAKHPDIVAHPFPVTPYHADYLGYVDLISPAEPAAAAPRDAVPLTFRAGDAGHPALLPAEVRVHATEWDIGLDEVSTEELTRTAGIGFNNWPAPPWAKEGWFQAYHLLRPSIDDANARERADALYDRRTHGEFRDQTERVNLERDLLAALRSGCERAVVGYRLRRDFYSDDFSNGIENIFVDSQSGFNSPIFVRVVKLKDFPWNGWLRLGIAARPQAAWNPVAGFTDAPGRLIWATTGDNAFLPIPHNSHWTPNRAEIRQDDEAPARQSVRIPSDALVPQAGSGKLGEVGPGKGAAAKVLYRMRASSFHDDTVMEPADLFYPFALAFRWGAGEGNGAAHDPEIAAATRLIRERLRGVRIIRVEESTLPIADLTFTYRSPIVEIYLDNLTLDDQENGLIAPPWSSVPWHVLALMEAAVERGIAAFSESEAKRRGLPWLDLVRDPAQLAKLRALIKEFAQSGYRPAALEMLVGPEDAKARWQLLDTFVEANGHLLVTNGPYRLAKWSPEVFVFNVVREFTYPIGIGTFNSFAYPPRASITGIEQEGNKILIAADAEFALKEQRDRRLVRMPLRRDTLRDTLPIQPTPQYVVIGADGRVAAAGIAARQPDERFAVVLPPTFPAGAYTLFTAIFLDGNTISPDIGRINFRSN